MTLEVTKEVLQPTRDLTLKASFFLTYTQLTVFIFV